MLDFNTIPRKERVIVALDCDRSRALELADMLAGKATWVKIGMTLFYQEGPYFITALQKRGFKVFLDLKFHDIPHQVKGAAKAAAEAGADMLTMHAVGGLSMMKAAKEGLSEARWVEEEPISLAITVLTSMSEEDLRSTGVTRKVKDKVIRCCNFSSGGSDASRGIRTKCLHCYSRCKACRRGTRRSNTCGNS